MINTKNLLARQIPHVKKLVDSLHLNGYAVDLSDTGCGKTYCAAGVAREVASPIFIVCPKIVIPAWNEVLKEFGIRAIAVRNYESLIRGNKNSRYTSWSKEDHPTKKGQKWERLRFNKRLKPNTFIIFDEAHKAKALDSTTSELLMTAREQGFKTLLVSASAATNPIEMKAFGYVTHLHSHYNHNEFKTGFAKAYGAEWKKGKTGGLVFDPTSESSQQAMRQLHNKLFNEKKCASRLTTDDMKEYFTDNHVMASAFDMRGNTDKINKVYDIMEYELAMLDEHSQNYSEHIFAVMMKARRHSELLKVPTYVESIEEAIRENKSVAIFLNFNESIDACVSRLEKMYRTPAMIRKKTALTISTIRGGQTAKAREEDIQRFQNDSARIIVCNISAGGVGVNLHDLHGNHARESLISPNYSAIQIKQALGRIWRANGKTNCVQRIVFAAGTIEEQACAKVQARLDNLSLLNDGDMQGSIQFYGQHVNEWEANK